MAQATDQRCNRCGTTYPARIVVRAFRTLPDGYIYPTCRPCEQTLKDQVKSADRWLDKAKNAIDSHAVRLSIHRADLVRIYGWNKSCMAVDAQHAYGGACPYCYASFEAMGHGMQDLTLDIVDPQRPPYYRTNTRWVCQTCNRKKGRLTPADFEADREIYERWELGRRAAAEARGMLF